VLRHYRTLTGSRTSLVDCYHQLTPPTIGSAARNCVSVPCDFTTAYSDAGINCKQVSCLKWEWHCKPGMTGVASVAEVWIKANVGYRA